MGRLGPSQLKAVQITNHKAGDLCDGGGLWLVAQGGSRLWEMRFTSPVTAKRRQMSLGSANDISLAEARKRAHECRLTLERGLDPLEERAKEKAARKLESGVTFAEVAADYIRSQTPGWSDPRAASIWTASLTQHVFSVFGSRPVRFVETSDVMAALEPIWATKTETAGRLRGRIERVLDYARAQGWREGENPARWKGHLSAMLPPPAKLAKVQHHSAIPWASIAAVMDALKRSTGVAAKAVRFTCLTAARSGEVRNAFWTEIDLAGRIWTAPADKKKERKEHRFPLSSDALAVLEEVLPLRDAQAGDLVFPGQKQGRPLSDVGLSKALHLAAGTDDVTIHGLRSTFRDWAAEATDYPRDVAEMALAHAVGNDVEAAYRRGDLLEKRRALMEDWAAFCRGEQVPDEPVS